MTTGGTKKRRVSAAVATAATAAAAAAASSEDDESAAPASSDDDDDRRRSSIAPDAEEDLEDGAPAKPCRGGLMAPWSPVEYRTLLRLVIVSADCGVVVVSARPLRRLFVPSLRAAPSSPSPCAVRAVSPRPLCAPSPRALSVCPLRTASPRALSARSLRAPSLRAPSLRSAVAAATRSARGGTRLTRAALALGCCARA